MKFMKMYGLRSVTHQKGSKYPLFMTGSHINITFTLASNLTDVSHDLEWLREESIGRYLNRLISHSIRP